LPCQQRSINLHTVLGKLPSATSRWTTQCTDYEASHITMESSSKPASTSLFQVYLRLRPSPSPNLPQIQEALYPQLSTAERFLTVEPPSADNEDCLPTHITLHPPSDSRKRAVEKFAFTTVFEEQTTQLDIFKGTGVVPLVEGVLGEGRDGLVATLGVTGSGKVCNT